MDHGRILQVMGGLAKNGVLKVHRTFTSLGVGCFFAPRLNGPKFHDFERVKYHELHPKLRGACCPCGRLMGWTKKCHLRMIPILTLSAAIKKTMAGTWLLLFYIYISPDPPVLL